MLNSEPNDSHAKMFYDVISLKVQIIILIMSSVINLCVF